MKLFISICLLSLFFLNPLSGFSQQENSKQVEISGVKYVLHTVKKSETVFSLCQKYKVTQKEIQLANPGLTTILKTGATIKIPVGKVIQEAKKETIKAQPVVAEEYYYHKVSKTQTLFSIAKQYGITSNELIRYNPELSNELKIGQVLKIPVGKVVQADEAIVPQNSSVKTNAPSEKPQLVAKVEEASGSDNCNPISGKNVRKYKVGLLLPLYLPGNEKNEPLKIDKEILLSKVSFNNQAVANSSDTTFTINGLNIDTKALGFLEFYEGALLAVDSLQRKGMNIELFVFDVTNQQTINALLQLPEFFELNLIIGPVFPELQESVASVAAKNRIPMVSPLSPAGNFEQNNSWYFKVNPTKEYQVEQSAAYLANELANKNIILLQVGENSNSPEAKMAQLCKEKLVGRSGKNLFHEYNFQLQGVNNIEPLLDKTGENIFIIPTDYEAKVSIAVTNLTALAENYDIVLMGTPNLTKLKSLQTENFHRIRLRFLSPYFVDYSKPLVRRFVGQYREAFAAEPTPFSFQGFDVSYYFLSALYRYGKDFRKCLPDYHEEMTQMVFNFRNVGTFGGFENHGMFITAYERNFDVLSYGIFGGK